MNANDTLIAATGAATAQPGGSTVRRLVALTQDPGLTRALEELSGLETDVVHVGTPEALAEALLDGATTTALVDAPSLGRPLEPFIDQLVTQFPDLRLIVAGHSLEQNVLATRISQGLVFRFLHKPASAQRLKLFVDAAARPADAQARSGQTQMVEALREPQARAATPAFPPASAGPSEPGGPRLPLPLPWLIGGAAGLLVIVGGVLLLSRGGKPEAESAGKPAATAQAASPEVEALVRSADQAFAAQRFAARDGTSSAELYQRALQAAPNDSRARSGLNRSIDFALRNAEAAFTEARYGDAEQILAALQVISPGNSRLAFLGTQLQRERERSAAEENRRLSAEARQEKLRATLKQANEALRRGALIEPANSSALELYLGAVDLAPNDDAVRSLRDRLGGRLIEGATQKLDAGDIAAARTLLDAAGSVGSDTAAVTKLRRRADELSSARAARASAPPAPAAAPAPAATPPNLATVQPVGAADATPKPSATAPQPAAAGAAASPPTIRIYTRSELTLLREVEIAYPERAIEKSIAGWLDVEFTIDKEGVVRNIIVLAAEPRNLFEANAMQALRRWRYKPVVENGTVVEARARLRLRFTPPPKD